MNHILYLVDKKFNILAKFQFAKKTSLDEFIEKHNAEEDMPNMLVLNFDENEDIVSLQIFQNGKLLKTTTCV